MQIPRRGIGDNREERQGEAEVTFGRTQMEGRLGKTQRKRIRKDKKEEKKEDMDKGKKAGTGGVWENRGEGRRWEMSQGPLAGRASE